MTRIMTLGFATLLIAVAAMPEQADAQNRETRRRLEAIEQQLEDLQGSVYGTDAEGAPVRFKGASPETNDSGSVVGQSSGSIPYELSLRISGLEQEIQRLTGEMERLVYQNQQQTARMDRLVQLIYPDYDEQVNLGLVAQQELVAGQPTLPGGAAPVDLLGEGPPSAALPGFSTAEAAYSAGRAALFSGRFAEAERAFLALTEGYPDSAEYADGLYYLGEVYLAQGELRASAEAYLDFIRNYGDHPNAARAHLKLGEAFARAERSNEACRVWLRAVQTYPGMDGALMAQIEALRTQNQCQGAAPGN